MVSQLEFCLFSFLQYSLLLTSNTPIEFWSSQFEPKLVPALSAPSRPCRRRPGLVRAVPALSAPFRPCPRRPGLFVGAVLAFLSAPSRPSCRRRPGLLVGAVPAFLSAQSWLPPFPLVHRHPGLDLVKLLSCQVVNRNKTSSIPAKNSA